MRAAICGGRSAGLQCEGKGTTKPIDRRSFAEAREERSFGPILLERTANEATEGELGAITVLMTKFQMLEADKLSSGAPFHCQRANNSISVATIFGAASTSR